MPTTTVLFRIPEDPSRIAAVAADHYGTFEDVGGDDPVEFMRGRIGETTSVVFEDCDDTVEPLMDMLSALKEAGIPYFAASESFTEQSRGVRVEARVAINLDGSPGNETVKDYPWKLGEPSLDEASLRNAGFPADVVDAMPGVFFPGNGSPHP